MSFPQIIRFAPAVAMADEQEFNLAVSNPPSSFWLLLHSAIRRKASAATTTCVAPCGANTPEYEKNRDCYDELRDKRDQAVTNAEQVLREQKRVSSDERFPHPSTHVHLLVQRLASNATFRD
jgi:hypothetical protein